MIDIPPILKRNSFKSEKEFIDRAYSVFLHDLVDYPPTFGKTQVYCMERKNINPEYLDTFWHIITEGSHRKNDRIDQNRVERIPWINPIISGQPDDEWLLWNKHAKRENTRTLIYSRKYKYLVVIEHSKKGSITFWTAYPIDTDGGHHERKLLKEYQKYKS